MVRRRAIGYFTLILATQGLAGPGDPTPATDLGVPITTPNRISYKTAYKFGPARLNLICWTTTAESGGSFYGMNLESKEVKSHPLHHLEAYPIVFGSDGKVYIGSSTGEVFGWNPVTDEWSPLGPPIFNWPGAPYNHIRVLCEGKDGWLYAGSANGERARINIATRKLEKLPETPEKGRWYVSSIATLGDGRIAFGYGHKARVFVYDPALGRDVGQWLPDSWTSDGFCITLVAGERVLYAVHFPSGRRGAFDASTGRFLGEVPWPPDTLGQTWSQWIHSSGYGNYVDFFVVPGTNAAITYDGKTIHRFDPTVAQRDTRIAPEKLEVSPSLDLAIRYDVTTDCRVVEYDITHSRVLSRHQPELESVERRMFSLGVGPDGNVYGGTYQSTLIFKHDPATGNTKVLGDHHPGWSGETYCFVVRGRELVCTSYTNGAIVVYDPASPWDCDRGAMKNPRFLGFFGQKVYRPFSTCISDDGRIWSAGPTGWGSVGGGIGWCDPESKQIQTTALADVPHSVLPLGGKRLLICSDTLARWWDGATNTQLSATKLPFQCLDACMSGRGPGSLLMLSSNQELHMVDVRTAGTVQIVKTLHLPMPCTRVIEWNGGAVVGGVNGFATVDLTSGAVNLFCSSSLGSRWAMTVAAGSVYFGAGGHLMRASLPGAAR